MLDFIKNNQQGAIMI